MPTKDSWLDKVMGAISSFDAMQSLGNVQRKLDEASENNIGAAIWAKPASLGIEALSQVGRPIAALGGAIGANESEAGQEARGRGESSADMALKGAEQGWLEGDDTFKNTVGALDVASMGVGTAAGLVGKGAKVASLLNKADLALSAADAVPGVANVYEGVRDKDLAKVGMGAFRIAGNAYGGYKAKQTLKDLGIKGYDEAFEYGPRALEKLDKRKTLTRGMTEGGQDFTVRSSPETTQPARELLKNKNFSATLADQVDFLHQVGKAFDEDDIVGSVGRASEAKYVDDFTPERIGEGVKVDKIHVNLDGNEYGSTLTAKDGAATVPDRPVMFNPIAQAKRVSESMRFLLDSDVEPVLLERALADVPEDLGTYVRGIRAGEARIPELELKYATQLYARNLFYNMGHEKVGHWLGATQHRKEMRIADQPTGPLLEKAPEYKDTLAAKDGTLFEMQPRQVSMDEKLSRGTTLFEPANNAVVTAINDPTRLVNIKSYMESPEFLARAKEWYKAAVEAPEIKVAKRSDRVVGRAESKSAMAALEEGAERAGDQPPTPPSSVPPGSSGDGPFGPQLEPLAKRIKASLTEHQKAVNRNELKKNQINAHRADMLRQNEEKLFAQQISAEDFANENNKIRSGKYDLVTEVNPLLVQGGDIAAFRAQLAAQANDDAFLRARAQDAFTKMLDGSRLEDNEIKLIREAIDDREITMQQDPFLKRIGQFFANATGGMRASMTAYDLSAAGRQALYGSVMNPKEAKEAFKAQIAALKMTQPEFDSFMMRLQDPTINPYAELAEAAGLHFSERQGRGAAKAEEAFMSGKWAEKLPGVKQSEQAYIAYLNKLRVELFNKHVKVLKDSGYPLVDSEEGVSQIVKDVAYMVNTLTGRGELSAVHISPNSPLGKISGLKETYAPGKAKMDQMHQGLTSVFFAPRFAASRAALMRDTIQAMLGSGLDPAVSRMYMKNVIGTIGVMTSTMAALAAMGVGTFNMDPRKKDFGVLKVGKTRYDVYGGLKPWAKITSLIGTDKYWSGRNRMPKRYGDGPMSKTKTGEVGRFVQSKLSPLAGFMLEGLTGEDFMGRKSTLWQNAYGHATPMILQTIIDLYNEDEMDQLPFAVPAAIVGLGVNTYSERRFKKER